MKTAARVACVTIWHNVFTIMCNDFNVCALVTSQNWFTIYHWKNKYVSNLATALFSGFLAVSVVYKTASVFKQACSKGPEGDSSSCNCSSIDPACRQHTSTQYIILKPTNKIDKIWKVKTVVCLIIYVNLMQVYSHLRDELDLLYRLRGG